MTASGVGILLLCLVAAQRFAELIYDRRNTAALLAQGGIEYGAKHYPLFILLHSSWLFSLVVWTIVQQITLEWIWVGTYLLLQGGRIWVIKTLGPYWTTRIISVPGRPLVKVGPYRYVDHPNYLIVVTEIAILPLAFEAWQISAVFSVLNGALVYHRIQVENKALAGRR